MNIVQNGKQTLNKRKFDRKNILDVIIYKRGTVTKGFFGIYIAIEINNVRPYREEAIICYRQRDKMKSLSI